MELMLETINNPSDYDAWAYAFLWYCVVSF